jgi:hypothetical protein
MHVRLHLARSALQNVGLRDERDEDTYCRRYREAGDEDDGSNVHSGNLL